MLEGEMSQRNGTQEEKKNVIWFETINDYKEKEDNFDLNKFHSFIVCMERCSLSVTN